MKKKIKQLIYISEKISENYQFNNFKELKIIYDNVNSFFKIVVDYPDIYDDVKHIYEEAIIHSQFYNNLMDKSISEYFELFRGCDDHNINFNDFIKDIDALVNDNVIIKRDFYIKYPISDYGINEIPVPITGGLESIKNILKLVDYVANNLWQDDRINHDNILDVFEQQNLTSSINNMSLSWGRPDIKLNFYNNLCGFLDMTRQLPTNI